MRIVVVCLGNICRSPAAEAVLLDRLKRAGLGDAISVSSAGTADYHVGERPDPTSMAEGERRGYCFTTRGMQLERDDLEMADLVLVMDAENEREVRELAASRPARNGVRRGGVGRPVEGAPSPAAPDEDSWLLAKVVRLGAFAPGADGGVRDVPDPWGRPASAFAAMYDQIEEAVDGLVRAIQEGRVDEVVAAYQVEEGVRPARNR